MMNRVHFFFLAALMLGTFVCTKMYKHLKTESNRMDKTMMPPKFIAGIHSPSLSRKLNKKKRCHEDISCDLLRKVDNNLEGGNTLQKKHRTKSKTGTTITTSRLHRRQLSQTFANPLYQSYRKREKKGKSRTTVTYHGERSQKKRRKHKKRYAATTLELREEWSFPPPEDREWWIVEPQPPSVVGSDDGGGSAWSDSGDYTTNPPGSRQPQAQPQPVKLGGTTDSHSSGSPQGGNHGERSPMDPSLSVSPRDQPPDKEDGSLPMLKSSSALELDGQDSGREEESSSWVSSSLVAPPSSGGEANVDVAQYYDDDSFIHDDFYFRIRTGSDPAVSEDDGSHSLSRSMGPTTYPTPGEMEDDPFHTVKDNLSHGHSDSDFFMAPGRKPIPTGSSSYPSLPTSLRPSHPKSSSDSLERSPNPSSRSFPSSLPSTHPSDAKSLAPSLLPSTTESFAPSSAPTIPLPGDDSLKRQGVDIFIIAGQSNAQGFGLVSDLTEEQRKQKGLFYTSWHQFANNAKTTQYFSDWNMSVEAGLSRSAALFPNRPNICKPNLGGADKFGPELGFVSKANEMNLTSNRIAVIKYGVDGSVSSHWYNHLIGDKGGADCWKGLVKTMDDAISKLKAQNIPFNLKGMIWWQGESGTSVIDLKNFIANVRDLFGSRYGLEKASEFPFVITGGIWIPKFSELKRDIVDKDANVEIVDANRYGQHIVDGKYNIHIGSGEFGITTDTNENGSNDMWDIGEAYAEQMMGLIKGSPSRAPSLQGEYVDIFAATGQSNAAYPVDVLDGGFDFGKGVEDVLTSSGQFSNPKVVINGWPGHSIASWFLNGEPNKLYKMDFFGEWRGVTGDMELLFNEIIAAGNVPRFRALFWFQGETDGIGESWQQDTPTNDYIHRWDGFLSQLEADIGSSNFFFVVNTVGNSGTRINKTLKTIADADGRGVIFDTQLKPYRTDFKDIHAYDHFAVGQANANLFMETFGDQLDI